VCVAKPRVALCSDDGRSSISTAGVPVLCDPYVCGDDGTCRTACVRSDQCAPGASCDTILGSCVAAATTANTGGCSTGRLGVRGARGGGLAIAFALGALLTMRRRASRVRGLRAAALASLAAAGSASACASPPTSAPEPADVEAGVALLASTATAITPAHVLATLAAMPAFEAAIGRARVGAAAGSSWRAAGGAIAAALPTRAGAPWRLWLPDEPSVSLEIVAEDAGDAAASAIEGARVALGDRRHADVVHLALPELVEEIRLVRTPEASASARYRVRHGAGITTVRVRDGRVEALDARGDVRLESAPMFAVDARGVRRALSVRAQDGRGEDAALIVDAALDTEGLALPIAIDPIWLAGAKPAYAHAGHTATPLASGKVLVAGGYAAAAVSEVFDPIAKTWLAGTMRENRYQHEAVRLADGRVLAIMGYGATGSTYRLSSSELYDPTTTGWKATGSLATGRVHGRATLLASGKVLYTGGVFGPERFSTAEVYDPTPGIWATGGTMSTFRYDHSAIRLASGKVLVAGGGTTSTAELYDPSVGSFTLTGALAGPRRGHTTSLLADGRVLVAGGSDGSSGSIELSTAEIYDPATGKWSPAGTLAAARTAHAAAVISRGRVLVSGGTSAGYALSSSEVYDPATNAWTTVGPLAVARSGHTETALLDGRVLAVGGANVELFVTSPQGAACGAAGECESGFCADGVCCATACNGKCDACNVAGSVGTCTAIAGASRAGHPACGPFLCVAGACTTSCTTAAQCDVGATCTAGACVGFKASGALCGASTECASGFCVDGVCCDKACAGSCVACNLPGSVGRCGPVSGAPEPGRAACASGFQCVAGACPASCTADSACAPGLFCQSGACVPRKALGAVCIYDFECASGACADGVCCDQACGGQCQACDVAGAVGTCSAVDGAVHGSRPKCAPFACVAGTCAASCYDDAACANGAFCDAGTCVGKRARGAACTEGRACATGHCADGVCCDRACDGQCEACDAAGACNATLGAPTGGRPACDDGGANACAARACNGSDRRKCAAYGASTALACAPARCDGVAFTAASHCDGAGGCAAPLPTSCVPFACEASGCKTSCSIAADCAPGFECRGGACLARTSRCSDDGFSAIDKDGLVTSCGKYGCRSDGTCGTTCAASTDCAKGFLCDPATRACVSPASEVPAGADASGGCAIAASRGAGGASKNAREAWVWLSAIAACVALVRRRRVRRAG
jgi:hypothetical protein